MAAEPTTTSGVVVIFRHGVRDNKKNPDDPPIFSDDVEGATPVPQHLKILVDERHKELCENLDKIAEYINGNFKGKTVILVASPFLRTVQTAIFACQYLTEKGIICIMMIDEKTRELSYMMKSVRISGQPYILTYMENGKEKTLVCELENMEDGYKRYTDAKNKYVDMSNSSGCPIIIFGHADMISACIPKEQAETVFNVPECSGIIISNGTVYCSPSINEGGITPTYDDFFAQHQLNEKENLKDEIIELMRKSLPNVDQEMLSKYIKESSDPSKIPSIDPGIIEEILNGMIIEKLTGEFLKKGYEIGGLSKFHNRQRNNNPE